MSDSIIVRVRLDRFDLMSNAKQTQVYVQIPEVARASWLLDAEFYSVLKSEPWPHVVDSAQECYVQRGTLTDPASTAARAAVVEWLLDDANHDAMHAAWEQDQARQHPVARKLLAENEQLRARIAELQTERHSTNEALADTTVAQRAAEVSADKLTRLLAPTQALREDEAAVFVPRTERSYWVAIADALNAAHAVGMPVGIDLDGTLTDHNAWSVVWDRVTEQWTVAGYDDASGANGKGAAR
ncbi:hypothetical protein [Streptomyces sp. NPDC020298]|uniref:hypothetical protein n=1 Tax=unclassified Streptomyces TaxID=2593676 RepID=UPI00340A7D27